MVWFVKNKCRTMLEALSPEVVHTIFFSHTLYPS